MLNKSYFSGRAASQCLLFMLAVCTVIMTAGCDRSESVKPPVIIEPTESDTVSLVGNISKPSWAVNEDYDYLTSMTAIIKVDLSQSYPLGVDGERQLVGINSLNDDDLLAAFIGDECVGVANLSSEKLFFLYLTGSSDSTRTDNNVVLRYYSAHLQNIFESKEPFSFVNDANLGSVTEPFLPIFK